MNFSSKSSETMNTENVEVFLLYSVEKPYKIKHIFNLLLIQNKTGTSLNYSDFFQSKTN